MRKAVARDLHMLMSEGRKVGSRKRHEKEEKDLKCSVATEKAYLRSYVPCSQDLTSVYVVRQTRFHRECSKRCMRFVERSEMSQIRLQCDVIAQPCEGSRLQSYTIVVVLFRTREELSLSTGWIKRLSDEIAVQYAGSGERNSAQRSASIRAVSSQALNRTGGPSQQAVHTISGMLACFRLIRHNDLLDRFLEHG